MVSLYPLVLCGAKKLSALSITHKTSH